MSEALDKLRNYMREDIDKAVEARLQQIEKDRNTHMLEFIRDNLRMTADCDYSGNIRIELHLSGHGSIGSSFVDTQRLRQAAVYEASSLAQFHAELVVNKALK